MVNFTAYFDTMVQQKPEWRRAYVDYPVLNDLLGKIKKEFKKKKGAGGDSAAPPLGNTLRTNVDEDENLWNVNGDAGSSGPRSETRSSMRRRSLTSHPESPKPGDTSMSRFEGAEGKEEKNAGEEKKSEKEEKKVEKKPLVPALVIEPPVKKTTVGSMRAVKEARRQSPRRATAESESLSTPLVSPEYGGTGHTPVKDSPAGSFPPASPSGILADEKQQLAIGVPRVTDSPRISSKAIESPEGGGYVPPTGLKLSPPPAALAIDIPHGVHLSDEVLDNCEKFESLLVMEVAKSTMFAVNTDETFKTYFETLMATWEKDNPKRVKDNLRYLHGEISHLVQFIETCTLATKTALKKYRKCHPWFVLEEINESVILPPLQREEEQVLVLRKAVEDFWADHFSDGDISKAKTTIHGKPASPGQSFRAGFLAAMIFACFLYWLHIWFELRPDPIVHERFARMYPVMRLVLALNFSFICWAGVLWVCKEYRINYLYVFQLSQLTSMSWMKCLEYSLLMFFLASLSCCLYVRSELQEMHYNEGVSGFREGSPWIFPTFLVIFILSIAFPYRHVFRVTRDSFFAVFIKCCILPWGYVRFVDFFIADWGTSFPYTLGDLLYTVCFYTAVPTVAYLNNPSNNICHEVRSKYYFPVAMIPYIWRGCQTFKMWRRTENNAHLVNHGKYLSMSLAYVTQWMYAVDPDMGVGMNWIVWWVHAWSQFYAYVWDVLMDWGWIKMGSRRMMFKTMTPYVSAMVFDFVARMYFIPLYLWVTPIIGMPNTILIQGMVEIFRRAVWSIFRIENENINNLETYRSIDFVPKVTMPE